MTAHRYGASFEVTEVFWNKIVVVVAQLCEYTKNHWIVYLNRVNLMVCELYRIKKKKKERNRSLNNYNKKKEKPSWDQDFVLGRLVLTRLTSIWPLHKIFLSSSPPFSSVLFCIFVKSVYPWNSSDRYSNISFSPANSHNLKNTISGIMPSRKFPDPFPTSKIRAPMDSRFPKCPLLIYE